MKEDVTWGKMIEGNVKPNIGLVGKALIKGDTYKHKYSLSPAEVVEDLDDRFCKCDFEATGRGDCVAPAQANKLCAKSAMM